MMGLFTQKALLPIWGLLIASSLLDVSARLSTQEVSTGGLRQTDLLQQTHVQKLSQPQAKQISSTITHFEAEPALIEAVETQQNMSEAEQLAQQGKLNQLYAGDLRFRLIGIFAKNGYFAVLSRKDIATDSQALIKVQVDEQLGNYKIGRILANQLQLEADDGRKISLHLFKKNNESQAKTQ